MEEAGRSGGRFGRESRQPSDPGSEIRTSGSLTGPGSRGYDQQKWNENKDFLSMTARR